jgi:hypothetical protein
MFVEDVGQRRDGIVYEGGVRDSDNVSHFQYRNMEPIIYAMASQGLQLNVYCKLGPETISRFTKAGAKVHDGMPFQLLLRELCQYKWGWTGFNNDPPKKHIQYVMTNKFFEYMAAGTPVLTYMTEEQNEIVEKYQLGLVIKKLEDIGKQIREADWEKIHENLLNYRYEFTMEKQLPKLEDIYERALAYFKKKDKSLKADKEIVEYVSYINFPIKPEDWWMHK